jgi:VanZ family protein
MSFLSRSSTWFIAVVIWYATLLFLSSQSQLETPGPEFMHRDKVMHLTYFALGGVFLFLALSLRRPRLSHARIALLVIVFCTVVGALDEFRQSFTPNRNGNDVGDWIADTLGGVIAAFIGPYLLPIVRKLGRRSSR